MIQPAQDVPAASPVLIRGRHASMLEEELSVRPNMEEREDVGLGVVGLYHLLKSDSLEVMERQQSARPEVVEVRKPREEESLDRNSARHSLKSQVVTDPHTIMPAYYIYMYLGVNHIKQRVLGLAEQSAAGERGEPARDGKLSRQEILRPRLRGWHQ